MHFSNVVLATLLTVSGSNAAPWSNSTNTTEKRYAILDNDWSATGFIPFLMAVDAGIEVLALTSGM